jgi:hypothetical protein
LDAAGLSGVVSVVGSDDGLTTSFVMVAQCGMRFERGRNDDVDNDFNTVAFFSQR